MKVRESASFVTERAKLVFIDNDKLLEFASSLKGKSKKEPAQFPLQFTEQSRVNFEVVRALLEFGSGFRQVLKKETGKGAHDTMTTGLFSLYITHGDISAKTLTGLSLFDVSTLFGLSLSVEQSVKGSLAGVVTELVDSPVKALCVFIHRVLGDCGKLLQARKCEDFYGLIVRELRPSASNPIEADRLIEMICTIFPAFNDVGTYEGREVFVYKKAMLLCSNLQFAHEKGAISFGVSGTKSLTVFADNVLPCVLRAVGVLRLEEELGSLIDSGKVLPAGAQELELRLVAVEACERLCKISGWTTGELDLFLWELGKEEQFRSLHRHYTQNTVFY